MENKENADDGNLEQKKIDGDGAVEVTEDSKAK